MSQASAGAISKEEREGCVKSRPPLACRPSPPQGGRLAVPTSRLPSNIEDWRKRRHSQSPPLRGRWPAGQRGA
ncbi:MAG: hypothetical protein EOS21_13335 [Mesorhizobium sp.]|nr:MAG: hypothetical protein EOS21_13335 [Mesorhizobium sp.]